MTYWFLRNTVEGDLYMKLDCQYEDYVLYVLSDYELFLEM